MRWFLTISLLITLLAAGTQSYKPARTASATRGAVSTELLRSASKALSKGIMTAALMFGGTQKAFADNDIPIYFGVGCFWHVQHEFVEAEKKLLGRGDMEVTSYAGYAGGKAGAKEGKVRSAIRLSESVSAVRLHHELCH